jgi:DNA-binding GntR family transcriptional regulator
VSPGPTFDRVYLALKAQLLEGRFAPGEPLEPGPLGDELHASITPVRDALHRLAGERLVEAPRHDGFRTPLLTEAGLRHLYDWTADLLLLALRRPASPALAAATDVEAAKGPLPEATDALFLSIVRPAGNPEHLAAIANAGDRLSPVRRREPELLAGTGEELAELAQLLVEQKTSSLRRAILRYHQRRRRAAPALLEALQASSARAR